MSKKINEIRKVKFQKKSDNELTEIVKSGSLSSAAAAYELKRRGKTL